MIMKNIIYSTLFLCFAFLHISCNHVDNCLDAAKDYGVTDVYPVTKKIFDVYKDKKYLVLKNENGDTLNFKIKYSVVIKNDTIANTFKNNKICTAEVYHFSVIKLSFVNKTNYYLIDLVPQVQFDYTLKRADKKNDEISGGWIIGTDYSPVLFDAYIDNPTTIKIPYKTVIIHGKNVEVIDTQGKTPEQLFIHEDKGIVAMIIPNHGSGYWVVDKIE